MSRSSVSVAGEGAVVSGPSLTHAAGNGKATQGTSRVTGSSTRVLVLNASYEPINVCTLKRAAVLVLKEKAEVLEQSKNALRSERFSMQRPTVIRLVTYVRVPRD